MTAPESPVQHRLERLVGVEEELLLIDPETGCPMAVASEILAHLSPPRISVTETPSGGRVVDPLLEPEVKQEQIEVVAPPARTYAELLATIRRGRVAADDAARVAGARAVALATAGAVCSPHPVENLRYEQMRRRFGLTFAEQLTCGFHVHVSVESAAEGVAVLDRIRPWLPVILALSANSPFWQGQDTGFASYRYQAWGRWPTAGAYEIFGTPDNYADTVASLLGTDVPLDAGMIYFDARLSTHAPTVETRIADVCLCPEDAARLAIIVRALVETAAQEWRAGREPDLVSVGFLRAASWRASRFGVSEMLVDPVTRNARPAHAVLESLLSHVRNGLNDGEASEADALVEAVCRRGTGADIQRRAEQSNPLLGTDSESADRAR